MRYLVVLIFKIVTRLKVLKELLTYFTLCTWSFQLGLCQNAFSYTRIFRRDAFQSQEHYSSITSFLLTSLQKKAGVNSLGRPPRKNPFFWAMLNLALGWGGGLGGLSKLILTLFAKIACRYCVMPKRKGVFLGFLHLVSNEISILNVAWSVNSIAIWRMTIN